MRTILLQRAFPDFPLEELPETPLGTGLFSTMMEDCSYSHDACPSFCLKDKADIRLFINRLNPEDRYDGPEGPRFCVMIDVGADIHTVYSGDDYLQALASVIRLDELTEEHGNLSAAQLDAAFPWRLANRA